MLYLPLLLLITSGKSVLANSNANIILGNPLEIISAKKYKKKYKPKNLRQKRYIVQLTSPSVSVYNKQFRKSKRLHSSARINLKSRANKSHLAKLKQEKKTFRQRLKKRHAKAIIDAEFNTLFNGMVVSIDPHDVKNIATLDGVKAVYPETFYKTYLDASHQRINSEAIWDQVSGRDNAGQGIKVAIIDTGIRPENPMFDDSGYAAPNNLPNDDYCSTTDSNFCNNKLIVARFSSPNFTLCENEHQSPLGYDGHGTHVAGIAVGNRIFTDINNVSTEISGVAPAAYLMAYKALFYDSNCDGAVGSDAMLLTALEHAVNDGAHVINNSWGGGDGAPPSTSPYRTVFENAEAAGIVIVSAAGNSGNRAKTIGCPACVEAGIAVANSTSGRLFNNSLRIDNSDYLAIEANNNALTQNISASMISAISIDNSNADACNSFLNNIMTNRIALISRGNCTFATKADNAQNAGAIAMVVYNNESGLPISMFMPNSNLPSVMISQSDGLAILNQLTNDLEATLVATTTRIINDELANAIAPSSSRGPNGDENILKPDIAAPGSAIYSAASPETNNGENFSFMTGTSMASPHVAGGAAIMRQLHPSWSAIDIKTVLMSTANITDVKNSDFSTQVNAFDTGSGIMDLERASNAAISFDNASFANNSCTTSCTFIGKVHNKSNHATSWDLSATADTLDINLSPQIINLAVGESSDFQITVNVAQASNDEWAFGQINFTSTTEQNAHLPVAVYVKESIDPNLLAINAPQTNIPLNDTFAINASFNNNLFTNAVTFEAFIPNGTNLTVPNNVTVTLNNANQTDFTIDEVNKVIRWQGTVNLPLLSITKSNSIFQSLISQNVTPIECNDGCDDVSFTFNVDEFTYLGQTYNKITMSDNGILVIGDGSVAGSAFNTDLPNTNGPNNILAPFWSDFDLSDGTNNDTGGGAMLTSSSIINNEKWLIFEWANAKLYEDNSSDQYTFSVWIRTGENEQIIFNYNQIPSLPSDITIGFENHTGILGSSYRYNNTGNNINSNEQLLLSTTASGNVNLNYQVEASEFIGQADAYTLNKNISHDLNVLENDVSNIQTIIASLSDNNLTANAQKNITLVPNGELSNISIVTQPTNGTTEIVNNKIKYTPNTDFLGDDSLTYQAQDSNGNRILPTLVSISIVENQDPPTPTPPVAPTSNSSGGSLNWVFILSISSLLLIRKYRLK